MNNRILYTPKEKKYFRAARKSNHLWMIVALVVCTGIVAGTLFAMRAQALQVKTISITGLDTLRENDIQQEISSVLAGSYMAGLVPYRFLLATPAMKIIERMKNDFPLIADVEVKKEFPHTLIITVKERTFFGIMCNDGLPEEMRLQDASYQIQCAYVDTNGVAYQQAPETSGFLIMKISTDAPTIAIGSQAIDPATMRRMRELNEKLPSAIGTSVTRYTLLHAIPREIRAVTKDRFTILLERGDDLGNTLYVLKTLLEKEIGHKRNALDYIDARFGNKIFYKFK